MSFGTAFFCSMELGICIIIGLCSIASAIRDTTKSDDESKDK